MQRPPQSWCYVDGIVMETEKRRIAEHMPCITLAQAIQLLEGL